MIDEKKIEEAAEKHMLEQFYSNNDWDFPCDTSDIKSQCMNDFKAGINWFLDNLWHDASEEPKEGMLVLTDTQSIANKGHICWQAVRLTPNGFIHNWSNYVKATKITRWLYLDDLLKGGK